MPIQQGSALKYGDNTVATSLLTFSKGTAHTDNRLPYLSQDADTETVQPRWCFSISIWVIVAVFAAVVILICFIRDYQMCQTPQPARTQTPQTPPVTAVKNKIQLDLLIRKNSVQVIPVRSF